MCTGAVLCHVAAANKRLKYKMPEQSSTRKDALCLSTHSISSDLCACVLPISTLLFKAHSSVQRYQSKVYATCEQKGRD